MSDQGKPIPESLDALQERAKELGCLYGIEDSLEDPDAAMDDVLDSVVRAIPIAWQHPETCRARITVGHSTFQSPGFRQASCIHKADIFVEDERVGAIEICYAQQTLQAGEGTLSPERRRFIDTIAKRVGHFLSLRHLLRLSELHRLVDREDKPPGNHDSTDETRRPATHETEYGGLCMTCIHSSTCAFPRRIDQPVLSCEEFDDGGKDHVETAATSAGPPVRKLQERITDAGDESSQYKGLCATCDNRETCTFPKPEGGIWHCEEFA